MGDIIRSYRLDFAPTASASERAEMCTLIEENHVMMSYAFITRRSGPFGMEYSQEISYAEITTMSDWEDASVQKTIRDNPIFAKSTLVRTS